MQRKSLFFSLIFLSFITVLEAQNQSLNATLLSKVPFTENSSDIWGYEKDSIHYAIIGNARKTSIFSLEDPKAPKLRYEAAGAQSIWRDIKSYKNHIYVTTDQGQDGVVIIDMTNAPGTITHTNFKPELTVGTDPTKVLNKCHNLYIDENGFMYLAGCDVGIGGILIFDLNANPEMPQYQGAANLAYSHDAFTRGDTLFTSEIYKGAMGIYDVTDKSNPVLLASQTTSRLFTHNVWPSDDGRYAFTTDEKGGAYVDAYDISDLNNIKLVDRFRPLDTELDNVIPHNTHYYNGYLVVSWYTDGLRIIDAHRPENLIEVAYYDTWEDPIRCHNGFSGSWGAFPYTGSNTVYASDINNGLFIVDVDYKRACYLEGKLTNEEGNGINNAQVEIMSGQTNREFSAPSGEFKTGQVLSGAFQVRISHPDYISEVKDVVLNNGDVTILDVQMKRRKNVPSTFEIRDESNFIGSKILLRTNGDELNLNTVSQQKLEINVPTSEYEIFITSWGYLNYYNKSFEVSEDASSVLKVTLEKGYQDNFEINSGWTVNSTQGMAGAWVLAKPRKTEYLLNQIANPGEDSDDDGVKAYITGNGLPGAGCDDVDNGVTTLTSPRMDLSSYGNPKASYDVWFFNAGGSTPINDTLLLKISNGIDEVVIDKIFGITGGWLKISDVDIKSFIPLTDSMHLIVEVSDLPESGHLVEAGFDNFLIKDIVSSIVDLSKQENKVIVAPNPVSEYLQIRLSSPKANIQSNFYITNNLGQIVHSGMLDFHTSGLDISHLNDGIYFLNIEGYAPNKFIKI